MTPDTGQPRIETRVLALIPAYNAAHLLTPVVQGARAHLPVLVVDDGSADDTANVAEVAGATVIRQRPNQGKGVALKTGFRRALEQNHDAVLTLDADGQHDPSEMPRFLDRYAATHADLIIGARDFSQMPFIRKLSNRTGSRAFSWAMRTPIRDNQSGYRLVSRRLVEATLESTEAGFELEVEQIVICLERHYALDWVPIRTIYGDEGSHIKPVQHVINFFRVVLEARRRTGRIHR
ncbi:MAG TPA: glycosyltransferase family 2 protein [Longimicrobiales bacterium]|nr:glycosyltransferase family 2 protein [Longimicrobiales bacterium]